MEQINWNLLEDKRRWVFKIPVGNLSENEIQKLIEKVKKKFM